MSNPPLKPPALPITPTINLSDRLPMGTRIGRYCIGQWLASGGTADVYTCYPAAQAANPDPPDKHRYVVKVFRFQGDYQQYDRRVRLFEKEVVTLRGLSGNIHIVNIFDDGELPVGTNLVRPFYILSRLTGGTLTSHIHHQQLDEKATAKLALGLVDALQFAHQRGVLHCDVKPDNVMLDDSLNPVWIDFGIAKELDMATDAISVMSEVGSVAVGTAPYMSPEHFAGRHALTPQSDIWSMGVLMMRMLTKQYPFGMHFEQVRQRTLFQRWQSVDQLPAFKERGLPMVIHPHLKAILFKCLQVELEDRYETAQQLKEDLLDLQEQRIPKFAMPEEAAQAAVDATATQAQMPQGFPQPAQPSFSNYAPFPNTNSSGNMPAFPTNTVNPMTLPPNTMNPMTTSNPYTVPYIIQANPPEKKTNWMAIVLGALAFLILVALIIWAVMRATPSNASNANPNASLQTPITNADPPVNATNPTSQGTSSSSPTNAVSTPLSNGGSVSNTPSANPTANPTTVNPTTKPIPVTEAPQNVLVQFVPTNGMETENCTINFSPCDIQGAFSQPFSFKTNQSVEWNIQRQDGSFAKGSIKIPQEAANKTMKLDWQTGKISL